MWGANAYQVNQAKCHSQLNEEYATDQNETSHLFLFKRYVARYQAKSLSLRVEMRYLFDSRPRLSGLEERSFDIQIEFGSFPEGFLRVSR